jgi:hypothetical protein
MSEQRHFYEQLPDEHPTEKAAEWARKHWLQRARRDANANTIRRVMNIAPRPDMRAGSEATRVDDEFSMFIEGTRREVLDVEMVWIDASDDSPIGFSACALGGFDVNIVGRQSVDGAASRRILLSPLLDMDDELRPESVVYQTDGYMTAQLMPTARAVSPER